MRDEIKSIADGVIESVKSYVSNAIGAVNSRLEGLEKSLKEIPAGENGKDGRDGIDGKDGKDGTDGVNGKNGTDGIDGKDGSDGINGKDADEEAITERCFAKMLNSDVFMQKMAEFASTKVLSSIQLPKDGKDGINGKDADPEFIRSEVAAAVAAIPVPENGKDGADGKDADESAIIEKVMSQIVIPKDGQSVTMDDVNPILAEMVARRMADIPLPKDGKSVTVEDVAPFLNELVEKKFAEIPLPKDGMDGENGKDADPEFIKEQVATAIASIPVPADGKSVTIEDVEPILEVAVSRWALDFERRAHDVLQTAVERLPKPKDGEKGEPGNDGFGIEDFVQRGDRTVVAIYKRGDETIEQEFKFPAVIDRGVFKSGSNYEQGDGVTYGGSFWIAQKDNSDIPGNSDAWRLAVKRGRDGKDAA
jgi:hypothetical protein